MAGGSLNICLVLLAFLETIATIYESATVVVIGSYHCQHAASSKRGGDLDDCSSPQPVPSTLGGREIALNFSLLIISSARGLGLEISHKFRLFLVVFAVYISFTHASLPPSRSPLSPDNSLKVNSSIRGSRDLR